MSYFKMFCLRYGYQLMCYVHITLSHGKFAVLLVCTNLLKRTQLQNWNARKCVLDWNQNGNANELKDAGQKPWEFLSMLSLVCLKVRPPIPAKKCNDFMKPLAECKKHCKRLIYIMPYISSHICY